MRSIRTSRAQVIRPVVEWRSASHLRDLDASSPVVDSVELYLVLKKIWTMLFDGGGVSPPCSQLLWWQVILTSHQFGSTSWWLSSARNFILTWMFRAFVSYCTVTPDRLRQKEQCRGKHLVGNCLPLRMIAHSLLKEQHVFAQKLNLLVWLNPGQH